MALGALPGDVRRLVLKEGFALAAIGVAMGLAGALALTRVLHNLLFETQATDPATLSIVAVAVLILVGLATAIPANRASQVDPMTTLRHE